MSEMIWTHVRAKLPADWANDPVLVQAVEILADEIAEHEDEEETGSFAWQGESNYGINDEVRGALDLLCSRGCPFDAQDDGKYDITGTWVKWRHGMAVIWEGQWTESVGPVVSASEVQGWLIEYGNLTGQACDVLAAIMDQLQLSGPACWDIADAHVGPPKQVPVA